MAWIADNRYLSTSERENNATLVTEDLLARGWSVNAIGGILGNMESESNINPGLWQSLIYGNLSGGYGLVQWTPATNYLNWCDANGYDRLDGNAQLKWIDEKSESSGQWIATSAYPLTFEQFKTSSESPEYLASAFLKNFERAGVEVEEQRRTQARRWYEFITSNPISFTPRLDDTGIEGSFYWYSQNPFYTSGYGLPNCTCYAWGRFWEIGDPTGEGLNRPTLPLGDAGTWFANATNYERGTTPQLGAVICWSDNDGGAGHVAIVEKIHDDGSITTSNSGWNADFFYMNDIAAGYSLSGYTFQGFIYNPHIGRLNPIKKKRKRKFNFILFNRQRRLIV